MTPARSSACRRSPATSRERKRAAAELAAQQEWFRVTLASIGDAVIASDASGRVTYMNAPAETLTGWPRGRRRAPLAEVFQIVNEKTREPVREPAGLVMRSGQIVGLANHTVLIGRDGTERPIADSAAPIRDGDGRIIGVVLVFRDVTEERRAEEPSPSSASGSRRRSKASATR